MKHVKTETLIKADIETIWKILSDFNNYKSWNPYIKRISGQLKEGNKLFVRMKSNGHFVELRPKIISLEENSELIWQDKKTLPWIMDDTHTFKLKKIKDDKTLFINYNSYKGFMSRYIDDNEKEEAKDNLVEMNRALKKLAESTMKDKNLQKDKNVS